MTQFVPPAAFGARLWLFCMSLAYAVAVAYCMSEYASVEWAQYGHSFGEFSAADLVLIATMLAVSAAVMPVRLEGPADVILVVVYLGVCVPGTIVPLGLERVSGEAYHVVALAITIGYAACCALVRAFGRPVAGVVKLRRCSPYVPYGILAAWVACAVILYVNYRSVMTLVSLDAIYDQREAGAATSRFMGYVQTYLGYVLSPALLAFGLVRRQWAFVLLGVIGGVLLYAVTAEKNSFAFPFLLALFHLSLTRRSRLFQSSSFVLAFLSIVVIVSVRYYESSFVAAFFAWYIGVRSLLTPGLFVAQYFDFFSDWGFTHWSQVSGFSAWIPPPPMAASSDRWPSLGHIVGEQFVGIPTLNANASFLTTDGIASFGAAGAVIAMLLLAVYLIALERVGAGVPNRFLMVIAMPIGLTLTNVSLFTVFLSFGGLFWLVLLAACFRSDGGVDRLDDPRRGGVGTAR